MSPLTLSRHRHHMLIRSLQAEGTPPLGRSARFTLYGLSLAEGDGSDDIVVVHDFRPAEIDNNIGHYVADELLPLLAYARPRSPAPANGYALSEQETFERYVGAIVRSSDGNERRAWHRFYDNTLTALAGPGVDDGDPGSDFSGSDFIGSFRAIYRRIAELAEEVGAAGSISVLDVGTCFGFLPLLLATREGRHPGSVIAGCDLNPALTALAEDYRRHRNLAGCAFFCEDILAAEAPARLAAAGPFEVVTAIHFLEHLAAEDTPRAMRHLWGVTGRRLIVAVPFEAEPDPRFGHRQVFDRNRLAALGQRTGGYCRTFEHHGGWLVVDRR